MGTDYKLVGIYKPDKNTESKDYYIKREEAVYEVYEFNIEPQPLIIDNVLYHNEVSILMKRSPIKTVLHQSLIFVCYKRLLCIYSSSTGRLVKELVSTEDILVGCHGFMLFDKVNFIVNLLGECIFINKTDNVLEFTAEGLLFLKQEIVPDDKAAKDSNLDSKSENESVNADSEGAKSGDNSVMSDSFFSIQSLKSKKTFDTDGLILYQDDKYTVYKDTAEIKNPIACKSLKLGKMAEKLTLDVSPSFMSISTANNTVEQKNVIFVSTKNEIFVIFEDFVVKKLVDAVYTSIVPERFVFHNYSKEEDAYWCLLLINCFVSTVLYKTDEIEDFLFSLANSSKGKELLEKFITSLKWNASIYKKVDFNKVLCKLYRMVDESKRDLIETWIDFDCINADQLYYIIIYKLDMVDRFIDLCINEKRLFYLIELKEFYYKIDRTFELKQKFLLKGLLIFEYSGLEHFYNLEREMIESQRRTYISQLKFQDSPSMTN